jgi:predicted NAD-dependent protein-ADP-ribosyltransferase YbiA (DUF1768 family)
MTIREKKDSSRRVLQNGEYARMFYSKTSGNYRALSNFSSLPITVPEEDVEYPFNIVKGRTFPTSEHLFHTMKYMYSKMETKSISITDYVDAILQDPDPRSAKQIGSKKFFSKHHLKLMMEKWMEVRITLQRQICIWKRDQHSTIILPLLDTKDRLVHYESCRTGKPELLFWGAQIRDDKIVGQNQLGILWEDLAKNK